MIEAAESLFVEQGFHATSVDQVAAEAGYTKGAVYSNFESKEDLFLAVYEQRGGAGHRRDTSVSSRRPAAAGRGWTP